VPSAAVPRAIADAPPSGATLLTRLPGRVSAVLPRGDGVVFIGTFDAGLYRFDPARDDGPVAVGELRGRERFVDALVEHDGRIVAATHRGAVVLRADGKRLGEIAPGEAVSSLAVVDGALVAGTAHGLWTGGGPVTGAPRATDVNPGAMARLGGTIFIGTEGAGLLQLAGSDVTRPSDWRSARISAVAATTHLFIGTEDGELWTLPAAQPLAAAASKIFWI